MPLVETALRGFRPKLFGSEEATLEPGDAAVIAALPDTLLDELATGIGATAERLAVPLANWARVVLNDPPAPPTPSETRAELKKLSKALDAAEILTEEITPAAEGVLATIAPDLPILRSALARFSLAAYRATLAVEVRKGPAPRDDHRLLVLSLADVYEWATDLRAGRVWNHYANDASGADTSRFPAFCRCCIKAVLGKDPGPLTGIVQSVARDRMRQKAAQTSPTPSVLRGDGGQ